MAGVERLAPSLPHQVGEPSPELLDAACADLVDASTIESYRFSATGTFWGVLGLPGALNAARDGDSTSPMTLWQQYRLKSRFAGVFTERVDIVNLGPLGNDLRHLYGKAITYDGTMPVDWYDLALSNATNFLGNALGDRGVSLAQIRYSQSILFESVARARVTLIDSALRRRVDAYILAVDRGDVPTPQTYEDWPPEYRDLIYSKDFVRTMTRTIDAFVRVGLIITPTTQPMKRQPATGAGEHLDLSLDTRVALIRSLVPPDAQDDVNATEVAESLSFHLSALYGLRARATLVREQVERIAAQDGAGSWHSDRRASLNRRLSASLELREWDWVHWLDSIDRSLRPNFSVGLDSWNDGYLPAYLGTTSRVVSAASASLLEERLRAATDVINWLRSTIDFERWRWSWSVPAVKPLITDTVYYRVLEQSWGISSNVELAFLLSTLATAVYALSYYAELFATRVWQRDAISTKKTAMFPTVEAQAEYNARYEARERSIVLWRVAPYTLAIRWLTYTTAAFFVLSLNYSFVDPVAVAVYAITFVWLVTIIADIYVLKFFVYAASVFFAPRLSYTPRDPVAPADLTPETSLLILNPLRPADDDQLRAVLRKNVDMLWGVNSPCVLSIIILQAVGNSLETFRRYEVIVREEVFDNLTVPEHVKDRLVVMEMGGVAKPHNMYKALRWLIQQREDEDVVTRDFIFGLRTEDAMPAEADWTRRCAPIGYEALAGRPLVYLGGTACYSGKEGQGSDSGILATVGGARLLKEWRGWTAASRFGNGLVLDSDNSVEPVTILRMLGIMSDDYMVYQPRINFYNARSSAYAYSKSFANEHLGNLANSSTTLIHGGIRSFGKMFLRLRLYIHEEIACETVRFPRQHHGHMFSALRFATQLGAAVFAVSGATSVPAALVAFGGIVGTAILCLLLSRHSQGPTAPTGPKANRFQEMFPLNRKYCQSEDAKHGVFGRAVLVMDEAIHEATPGSFLDDLARENSKWLPTFDVRDFVLLHSPIPAAMRAPRRGALLGLLALAALVAVEWWNFAVSFSGVLHVVAVFALLTILAWLWLCRRFARSATPDALALLADTRWPEMPLRGEYAESLVTRGIWSEIMWLTQVVIALGGLLIPGLLEVAFPIIGELLLFVIVFSIVHSKFTVPFVTRCHRLARPPWIGSWSYDELGVRTSYTMARRPRSVQVARLAILWPLHDVPLGFFEFATSTAVYLVKLTIKPFEVAWSLVGCVKELDGLLSGVPTAGTWPSFVESDATLPLSAYTKTLATPLLLATMILLLVIPSSATVAAWPGIGSLSEARALRTTAAVAIAFIGLWPLLAKVRDVAIALNLHLWPRSSSSSSSATSPKDRRRRPLTFATLKLVLTTCGVALLLVCIVLLAVFITSLITFLPAVFLWRAFPLLVSSWLFGPYIAWALGIMFGHIDTSCNPPLVVGGAPVVIASVGLGYVVAALTFLIGFVFPEAALPVSTIGTFAPTGDGSTAVILPYSLSYHELLEVPPVWALPYVTVVYGGVVLGILSVMLGVVVTLRDWIRWLLEWRAAARVEQVDEAGSKPSTPRPATSLSAATSPRHRKPSRDGRPRRSSWQNDVLARPGSSRDLGPAVRQRLFSTSTGAPSPRSPLSPRSALSPRSILSPRSRSSLPRDTSAPASSGSGTLDLAAALYAGQATEEAVQEELGRRGYSPFAAAIAVDAMAAGAYDNNEELQRYLRERKESWVTRRAVVGLESSRSVPVNPARRAVTLKEDTEVRASPEHVVDGALARRRASTDLVRAARIQLLARLSLEDATVAFPYIFSLSTEESTVAAELSDSLSEEGRAILPSLVALQQMDEVSRGSLPGPSLGMMSRSRRVASQSELAQIHASLPPGDTRPIRSALTLMGLSSGGRPPTIDSESISSDRASLEYEAIAAGPEAVEDPTFPEDAQLARPHSRGHRRQPHLTGSGDTAFEAEMTRILRNIEAAESGRSTPAPDILPQSATTIVATSPRPFIPGSVTSQPQTRSRRPSTGHRASSPTAARSRARRSHSVDRGRASHRGASGRRLHSLPRSSSDDAVGAGVRGRHRGTDGHHRHRRSASSAAVRATYADRAGPASPLRPGSPALAPTPPTSDSVPGIECAPAGHGAWSSLSSVVHRAVEGTIVHPGEALAPLRAFASTLSGVAHVDPATARTFWFDEATSSWITQAVDVGYLREAQLASLAGSPREWLEQGDGGEVESA
jgi:hypothetical protein